MILVRKIAIGVCLLGLSATSALAQDVSMTKGVVVGFAGARLNPAPDGIDVGMKKGIIAGGFVTLPVSKKIGLTIEAEFSQKHSKATAGTVETNIKLDYLAVPVLATIPIAKGFYTTDGISLDFPLQARTETVGTTKATDFKSSVTNPDFGVIVSVGHTLGTPQVMLEGRFDAGLRKVIKTDGAVDQKNQSLALVLRASF
jgi:hypothetical protein